MDFEIRWMFRDVRGGGLIGEGKVGGYGGLDVSPNTDWAISVDIA